MNALKRWPLVLVIAAMSLILLWRRPDIATNPQFWAEDGTVFFMQAGEHGVASLALPYAGYFHFAARTTAWVGAWLPAEYVPHAYAFASWLLLALVVVYVFSDRLSLRVEERAVLGVALVGTTGSNEVFFNLANWATLTALWLILLSVAREPGNRKETTFDIALLVMAGLSTPFATGLWMLFATRFALRRTPHSAVLLVVSLAVAIMQLWHMGPRVAAIEATPLLERIAGLAYRLGFVFFGEAIYRFRLETTEQALILAAFGLVYALTAWRAWVTGTHASLVLLLAHGLVGAVSFYAMGTWGDAYFIAHTGRHQYLLAVTLVWAFACLRIAPAQWIPVAVAFAAFVFLNPANKRDVWPDLYWKENVARCRVQSEPCRIIINPLTPPPQAWTVTIGATR
jgi:hypothetical protein